MKKRPLFGETFSILIAMVIIAITPVTIFNIRGFKDFFYAETEVHLIESCMLMKNLYISAGNGDDFDLDNYAREASASTTLRVTIIDENGLVLSDSHNDTDDMNNHADRPEVVEAIKNGAGSSIRNSATMAHEMMYAAVSVDLGNGETGTIRLARALEDIENGILDITRNTLLICFLALFVAAWISYLVAGPCKPSYKKNQGDGKLLCLR